ncbi:RHS repeat protein [Flavobacterium hiemivividum]|uniref:RHS repeat protein n=1 Tax=Flavobacterium hiemivividum TaxID=2541734 RepID=A0A4R5CYS9_9FLAO|nr:RHS repeat protein [Flavobacterium hiemivividum]TDE03744.1 hypothetical protein E0F98_09570 [Flavobacterium hiemivividum]
MNINLRKITVIFLFLFEMSIAQTGGTNSPLQEQIPVSPNAAELGKYGQVPVGLFTGTIQYSIPIYEIKVGKYSLPIDISYSSNGVNVDKYPSSIGIDWALNAGGVVNRILADDPDESCRVNFPPPPYYVNNSALLTIINNDCADTQPDIFTFSVGGHSGKFYLDQNMLPKHIEPSAVKIEILENFFGTGDITNPDMIITTPDGTKYWFGGNNGAEESFSRMDQILGGGSSPPSIPAKMSWYLSKIQTIDNKEIIFNYSKTNFVRNTGVSQTVKATAATGGLVYTGAQHEYPIISKTYSNESFLRNITWDNGLIEFEGSDLVTGINIKNSYNQIIKKYGLNYLTATTGSTFKNPECSYCDVTSSRPFLIELLELNPSNSNDVKKHAFEYHDPSGLPPRLTYARDHWGYFNGKNNQYLVPNDVSQFVPTDYTSTGSESFSYDKIQELFRNIGGNRNADPQYGIKGLLKKVTFPTKGFNEFIYEPHSIYGDVPYKTTQNENISVNTMSKFSNSNSIIVSSPIDQDVYLRTSVRLINQIHQTEGEICDPTSYPTQWIRGTISVVDLTTNTAVVIYQKTQGLTVEFSGVIVENTIYDNLYVKLLKDHNYSFKISLVKPCLDMALGFTYNNTHTIVKENIAVGGMRIKSVVSNDGNGHVYTEDYKYGDFNCLDCSSGVMETIKPAISFYVSGANSFGNPEIRDCRLGSSSLNSLYFSQSYHIAYPVVIKKFNNANGKGSTRSLFDVVFDSPPFLTQGDWIPGTPYTNSFGNGSLLKEEVFDENLVRKSEKSHVYSFDDSFDSEIEGHSFSSSNHINIANNMGNSYSFTSFMVNKYKIKTKRRTLSSTIQKDYFSNGSYIESVVNYSYSNPSHLQLTSQTSTTSNTGEVLETKYLYAPDGEMENEPFRNELIASNMIGIPISTQTFKSTVKLSEQKTVYEKGTTTSNLLLPKNILAAKFPNATNGLENKITYNQYDYKGNLLQYTLDSGISVVLIWGYNQTQPIAKIENATYNLVTSYVSNIHTLSNTGTEAGLLVALDNLRNASGLAGAVVTTYTYKPLIGVSTITDSKGYRTFYEYDEFNRLKLVKDAQGNILSENEYHYKN